MNAVCKNNIGPLLKDVLKQRSFSMRQLSRLTDIDPSTISRIINGKRKARPEHIEKFADILDIPVSKLYEAAGYPIDQENGTMDFVDIYSSIYSIQNVLESTNLYKKQFTMENVKHYLKDYMNLAKMDEGKETILKGFEEKLKKLGSIGPFIDHLKDMFVKFSSREGTPRELALMGGALLYFISPVDLIPDYIFPIGYLDDAFVVTLVLNLLEKK